MSPEAARRRLRFLFAAVIGVTVAFVGAILATRLPGVVLHESAATLLLVLLCVAVWEGQTYVGIDPGPRNHALLGIGCLVLAAAGGALLASGRLGLAWAGLPLVPLLGLVLTMADGLRMLRSPGAGASTTVTDGASPVR